MINLFDTIICHICKKKFTGRRPAIFLYKNPHISTTYNNTVSLINFFPQIMKVFTSKLNDKTGNNNHFRHQESLCVVFLHEIWLIHQHIARSLLYLTRQITQPNDIC